MLRKILVASCLLATSMATQASLISHYGYERDSSSNIVKGGGLEWLKWDVTKGMSIDSALSTYSSQGWRLASNNEMASLFNSFTFGKTGWHADEIVHQYQWRDWNSGDEFSVHINFVRLFGATWVDSCQIDNRAYGCISSEDPIYASFALFGDDKDQNGRYSMAFAHDDFTYVGYSRDEHTYNQGYAALYGNYVTRSDWANYAGVAFVRDVPVNVAVPTPGSIGLLALGLFALGLRRRKA